MIRYVCTSYRMYIGTGLARGSDRGNLDHGRESRCGGGGTGHREAAQLRDGRLPQLALDRCGRGALRVYLEPERDVVVRALLLDERLPCAPASAPMRMNGESEARRRVSVSG